MDYSVQGLLPADEYNRILAGVAKVVRDLLNSIHAPNRFDVSVKVVVSRDQHEDNQDTHKFVVKFPWHLEQKSGRTGRTIQLDTSHSEPVLLKPEHRNLIHHYSHSLAVPVKCAALEEIVAEKYVAMCAVADQRERQERTSTRPRDYFDVRYALSQEAFAHPMDCLAAMLVKAERRGVKIRSIKDLVSHSSRPALERDWMPFLGDVVPNLPSCDTTLKELEMKLQELFPDMAASIEASRKRASQIKSTADMLQQQHVR